jgi:O-antigen ligase
MHWILLGYMFLFVHRPFEVWPFLADIRLERLYGIFAIVAVALSPQRRWLPNWQHAAYAAFWVAVLFCWAASPWMDQSQPKVEDYFKIVVFYLLLVSAVSDEKGLRRMMFGFLVIMAVYMLHSLKEYFNGRHTYRMGTTRMIGVDLTAGDPNTFGASILFALPLVVPFWLDRPSKQGRAFLAGYMALSAVCIVLTGSRSSFIGLILALLIMIWRSPYRWRWYAASVVLGPVLFLAAPENIQKRFETIVNPDAGPANAKASGESRLEGLYTGLELWAKNPLTGIGPGAWRPATRSELESHNLFGQLLGEMGSFGAVAFIGVLLAFWMNLRRVKKAYRSHPEWGEDFVLWAARAVGFGVFLMLFEGNFGHNLFRHNWLWYGGFLIVAEHCVARRLRQGRAFAPAGPWLPPWQPGNPVPLPRVA